MLATTLLIRVVGNIDFFRGVIIAIRICHDTISLSRYLIRYDTIYRAITTFISLQLLHCEHGTGCQWSWNCCDRQTRFIMIWKHFYLILSTGTRIRIDSVMWPQSSSRGHNTSASVTVTVVSLNVFWMALALASFIISLPLASRLKSLALATDCVFAWLRHGCSIYTIQIILIVLHSALDVC